MNGNKEEGILQKLEEINRKLDQMNSNPEDVDKERPLP
ncbi:uncharacterized protein YfkK (UPF0435 family) [Halobacillus andaensis]|nr:uncharacterized protein YfkK (UPF0435 family) [Halobacillus andaensis]